MHAVFDPFIFALPNSTDRADVLDYFDNFQKWCTVFMEYPSHYSISEIVVTAMCECNIFPSYSVIKDLISQYSINSVTAYDFTNMISEITSRRPSLEQVIDINAVVLSDTSNVVPTVYTERLDKSIRQAYLECLFQIGIYIATNDEDQHTINLATSYDINHDHDSLLLRGDVELADGKGCKYAPPFGLIVALECIDCPYNHANDYRLEDVWSDPIKAVKIAYNSLPAPLRKNTLGDVTYSPGFVESLQYYKLHTTPSVLRRMYLLAAYAAIGYIQNVTGAKLHAVRESRSANAKQLTRADGAKKWRCQVTKFGAGYRLQYWSRSGNSIELEKVVIESEV